MTPERYATMTGRGKDHAMYGVEEFIEGVQTMKGGIAACLWHSKHRRWRSSETLTGHIVLLQMIYSSSYITSTESLLQVRSWPIAFSRFSSLGGLTSQSA